MVGERRATKHPCAAGTVLKRVRAIKGIPLPIRRKMCESSSVVCSGAQGSSSLVWGEGLMFRPGRGLNYFQVSHFTWMHCAVKRI